MPYAVYRMRVVLIDVILSTLV